MGKNRIELTTEQLKNRCVEILSYLDNICRKNDIQYYLAYGTVIGAVRHKGFIPWDDDIDICMTRENFYKLAKTLKEDGESRFKLLWVGSDSHYTLPLPKVIDTETELFIKSQKPQKRLGVFVDVFILDNVPNDEKTRERFFKKLEKYEHLWTISQYKRTKLKNPTIRAVVKRILYTGVYWTNPRFFAVKLEKLARKYYGTDCERIGTMSWAGSNRRKQAMKKEIFGEKGGVELFFENKKYFAPEQYDKYLKTFYNDYMQLPPEDQRVSNHTMVAYLKTDVEHKVMKI